MMLAKKLTVMATVTRPPKLTSGGTTLVMRVPNPRPMAAKLKNSARPVEGNSCAMRSSKVPVPDCINVLIRWVVWTPKSIANPVAMAANMEVPTASQIPPKPMTPYTSNTEANTGTRVNNPALNERNSQAAISQLITSAMPSLTKCVVAMVFNQWWLTLTRPLKCAVISLVLKCSARY